MLRSLIAAAGLVAFSAVPAAAQTNVAQGKAAVQSSTMNGGVAARAVDGNTSGNWSDGSVTHTGLDQYAWWYVDLGGPFDIGEIRVWNRTDDSMARLYPFRVAIQNVFDAAVGASTVWHEDVPDTGVYSSMHTFNAGGATGRYVKVQIQDTNHLHLAEVEVFGTSTVPEPLSLLLLGTGLAGVAGASRRRRKQQATT